MSDLVATRDRGRFAGPSVQAAMVSRTRLDGHYASATGRVVRVLAPAGYGKSTLVSRWAATEVRRVRWLDIEPIDNDPLVLASALARVLTDPGDPVPVSPTASALARLVEHGDEPFVLVLDDMHHIDAEAAAALVELVVEHLPAQSTLILIGRAHHRADSLARFRLEPGVIDLGPEELAFDLAETESLLSSIGIESEVDEVAQLRDQFDGWPAGLRLAGTVLRQRRGEPDLALTKLGEAPYVTEYITAEWFARLGSDDRSFLAEAGCLGRFTGEMCDVVLGRSDSAAVLRRLCREELMLTALDQHDEWFRVHPLLGRWLSSRLRNADRERWCEVLVAAARWWELNGDVDLAVEYAAKAGDTDLCEDLIIRRAGTYLGRGMYPTVRRWLANFSDERIRSSPQLGAMVATVSLSLGEGEPALHWTRLVTMDVASSARATNGSTDDLSLRLATLQAVLETRPAAELVPIAEHARRHVSGGPWRVFASWSLGANLYLAGDTRGIEVLRTAEFEAGVDQLTTMQANILATLAILLDLEGRDDESAELTGRSRQVLSGRRNEVLPPTAIAEASAALVDARAARYDRAAEHLALARSYLTGYATCAPWFNVLGLLTVARTCLLLDDAQAAGEVLQLLDHHVRILHPASAVVDHIDALGKEVAAATELLVDRSWSLTAAELRVVQYLPTNLSLADIADRLFVSRNTVKSHAAAVYRKLGTSSRGEAVDLARRSGLIDETKPNP